MKRLRQDPDILKEYDAVIRDQIEKGIVEEVNDTSETDVGKVHYLPHHAVIRRDKATTKLRIVYHACAKANGPSLNDSLHIGPALTQNIVDILIRFRTHKVALTADIEKAFLMASVAKQDRDVLRFLWLDDINKGAPEIVTLRFARVVIGVSASPFLLNATIKYHIERYEEEDPEFVERFLRSIYVDDLTSGGSEDDAVYEQYLKAKLRLAEGGFNLRKFSSNSTALMQQIAENEARAPPGRTRPEDRRSEEQASEEDESYAKSVLGNTEGSNPDQQKVLGVGWDPESDDFSFDLRSIAHLARTSEPTKRNVLRIAAKFYDPIGYLTPVIVQFKMLFQELYKGRLDWSAELTGDLKAKWQKLVAELQQIDRITLPRYIFHRIASSVNTCSLYGFCDASNKAYAAVVYLQVTTTSGSYLRFLASKTRVAPVAQQTIPRLELLSALILARLVTNVRQALEEEIKGTGTTCWSDSEVALFWIWGESKTWKPFVQNRVEEIRSLVPVSSWKHCPGTTNPADLPSRGMTPMELSRSTLWKYGPCSLVLNADTADPGKEVPNECLTELKSKASSAVLVNVDATAVDNIIDCKDYSNLKRLLRVTAYVLRFVQALKARLCNSNQVPANELSSEELAAAEALWIRDVQAAVRRNPKYPDWSRQLDLFTDATGMLRCEGRLENAELPSDTKNPILLDAGHHVTTLIVMESHRRVMHCGVKATLTQIRARFWIVRGRQFVRKILHRCTTCRRLEGQPYRAPPAPPLPEIRVKEATPFLYTAVDFAGSLYVKSLQQSASLKVWICLYTCCVTRAVHLDVVPDLTTAAFLRSFRRFTARRGSPLVIVSDNGSTFKPASQQIMAMMTDPSVQQYLAMERMQWRFNLEKAPWWGGFFERLVKSVKRCLKKTIGGAKLTYEELLTVVVEAEAILNSRPLSYVSTEDLEEPLTPSHLLCGRRLLTLPDDDTSDAPEFVPPADRSDLTKRLRHLSNVMNHFWRRWRDEYLLELRTAHRDTRSKSPGPSISVGDVVVVHEDNLPRGLWKLGLAKELIVGNDGYTRGAAVTTQSKRGKAKVVRRPVQHLYPVELCNPPVEQADPDPDPEVNVPMEPAGVEVDSAPDVRGHRTRRSAAMQADRRRRRWIEELSRY